MKRIVTSAQIRACDRFTIEKLMIPGLVLMENAGRGVVQCMQQHFGDLREKSVIIFAGKGNNGGDGFVAARHLDNLGANVVVVMACRVADLSGDALVNYKSLLNCARIAGDSSKLALLTGSTDRVYSMLPKADFIIDAIFGTGFAGKVKGSSRRMIEYMNDASATRVCIDIPSGLNADNGRVTDIAVRADLTVTCGAKKSGLILNDGMTYSGLVEVINISIPQAVFEKYTPNVVEVEESDVRRVLPRRLPNAHKHSVGKVFVLAGSIGFTGAAAMVSTSVLSAGAGTVVLGTPASVYPILAKKLTEVMVQPLTETEPGAIAPAAFDFVEQQIRWADVVVVGPGLSTTLEVEELVCRILAVCEKPLIVDADGLNVLARNTAMLKRRRSKNVILTPHTGEFSRLSGVSSKDIESLRLSASKEFAKEHKLTLVLKGAPSVTAAGDGIVFVNTTGNPGMATAGAGDVLAGLIGGLWAQGMTGSSAAYAGVYIHGLAGDIARDAYGEKSMMATDIQAAIPRAFLNLEAKKSP